MKWPTITFRGLGTTRVRSILMESFREHGRRSDMTSLPSFNLRVFRAVACDIGLIVGLFFIAMIFSGSRNALRAHTVRLLTLEIRLFSFNAMTALLDSHEGRRQPA